MSFQNEEDMSRNFRLHFLDNMQVDNIKIFAELKGLVGIPDFVVCEHTSSYKFVVSFELKLINWRRALSQAFKYRTFSNLAYVVIDESRSSSAIRNINCFRKYNIGLATFNNHGNFTVYFHPNEDSPFSLYYVKLLNQKLFGDSHNFFDRLNFCDINFFQSSIVNKKIKLQIASI